MNVDSIIVWGEFLKTLKIKAAISLSQPIYKSLCVDSQQLTVFSLSHIQYLTSLNQSQLFTPSKQNKKWKFLVNPK